MECSGAFWGEQMSHILEHNHAPNREGQGASLISQPVTPPHLQVVQEPSEVQPPFSSIPVAIGTDVFEASVSKHAVVVLWEEEGRTADD